MKNYRFLILGGGIAGLAAARCLALAGARVVLAEREATLGGRAANFCCKATTKCSRCGACLVTQAMKEVTPLPNVQVVTRAELQSCRFLESGGLEVDLAHKNQHPTVDKNEGSPKTEHFDALVVATGYEPFDASRRKNFGYGRFPNVVTGIELETMLKLQGAVRRPSDGAVPKQIAFIQCVGSRNIEENAYCSRVCCMFALRTGLLITNRVPETAIDVFYMDIQWPTAGPEELQARARRELNLIRQIPGEVSEKAGGNLLIRFEHPDSGEMETREYDLVVLSVGISHNCAEQNGLAALLGLSVTADGFFAVNIGSTGQTETPCVFVAGTCAAPLDIPETLAHAEAVAGEVLNSAFSAPLR